MERRKLGSTTAGAVAATAGTFWSSSRGNKVEEGFAEFCHERLEVSERRISFGA